jgi:branched-chain amino acid transport system substrate-binding protein
VGRSRLSAFLLAAALLAGCRSDAPVAIGIAGPFSEARGRAMLQASRLAVNEINAAGGVSGRPLELVVQDDSAQPARAIAIATAFRADRRIVAVIGHLTSATTIAAAGIYNDARDPLLAISPSASNPDLSGTGRFVFRACATDLAHGPALARYAFERLRATNAAVLFLNDEYGRGLAQSFAEEFQLLGGTIVAQDPVLPGVDVTPFLERLAREGGAQVLVLAGDRATATAVLRAQRAQGLTLPVIGGDGLAGIEAEGGLAEGVVITTNYLPDLPSERNAAFLRAYAAAYPGEQPDHRGAGAYDAVHLVAAALREGGPRRAALRDAVARTVYEGVTGRITFDERGDVPDKVVHVGVVRGGRLVAAAGP